jgi:hypothetical protein
MNLRSSIFGAWQKRQSFPTRVSSISTYATVLSVIDVPRSFGKSPGRAPPNGLGHWRKCKGLARVKLRDGAIRLAEPHWYEATGIGRYEFKIKRYLD